MIQKYGQASEVNEVDGLITVQNVRGRLRADGTAELNLEDVARGLGFVQMKSGVEYVRWETVTRYLKDFGFSQLVGKDDLPEYVAENIVYKLCFKAENQTAKEFQNRVTDEILPTIRKTGGYVASEDLFINTYLPFADEQTKSLFRATLFTVKKQNEQIASMSPKAAYFDALVDRNLLTNFRDTSKELKVKERDFITRLLEHGFVYRDQKDKLKPYAQHVPELFEIKDWTRGDKTGVQTLITPRGRETFRLLLGNQKQGEVLQLVAKVDES